MPKSCRENHVSAVCGAVAGGFAATGFGGLGFQIAIGALTSGVDSGYSNYNDFRDGEKSAGEAVVSTLVNAGMGALTGAMGFEGKTPFKTPLKKVWWKCVAEETVVSSVTTAISWGTGKVSELAYKYYEGLLK